MHNHKGVEMKLNDLKMPKLHIHCKTERDGLVLTDTYQIGHSWTRNAYHVYNLMMMDSLPTTDLFTRETGGTFPTLYLPARSVSTFYASGYYNNANTKDYGIVIGTGSTAFHLDDFRLETYIAHGNTTGQLYHQAQVAPVVSWTGSPDYEGNILHKRVFNNNSGGSITVNEVGIVYYAASAGSFLMSRDVLDTPVAVANGAQLTITISMTTASLVGIQNGAPDLGALGSGGIYIGQYHYDYNTEAPGSHGKYGIILAPLTDGSTAGQSSALAWRNPAATVANTSMSYYGGTNTTSLCGEGASSPIGAFVTAANAASLGGFTDWYIPAYNEASIIYTNRAYIPAGEECDNAYYWTSTISSSSWAYARNPITNATSGSEAQTATYKTRLIRRFLISTWVAD